LPINDIYYSIEDAYLDPIYLTTKSDIENLWYRSGSST